MCCSLLSRTPLPLNTHHTSNTTHQTIHPLGRDEAISKNAPSFCTGRVYLATSKNGLDKWVLHEDSPSLNPSKDEGNWFYFDSEHVGAGCVIIPGKSNYKSKSMAKSEV